MSFIGKCVAIQGSNEDFSSAAFHGDSNNEASRIRVPNSILEISRSFLDKIGRLSRSRQDSNVLQYIFPCGMNCFSDIQNDVENEGTI
uniref:Uncharacterized protein n=1 Tax=Lepeophtheirus salmonis TaxID=72036 RepID=A0A0K2UV75_LEPSM